MMSLEGPGLRKPRQSAGKLLCRREVRDATLVIKLNKLTPAAYSTIGRSNVWYASSTY